MGKIIGLCTVQSSLSRSHAESGTTLVPVSVCMFTVRIGFNKPANNNNNEGILYDFLKITHTRSNLLVGVVHFLWTDGLHVRKKRLCLHTNTHLFLPCYLLNLMMTMVNFAKV